MTLDPSFRRIILVLASVVACVGCATPKQWAKDGATQDEFARDRYQCIQESKLPYSQAYVNPYYGGSSQGVRFDPTLFQACMEARGYSLVDATTRHASPPPPISRPNPPNPVIHRQAFVSVANRSADRLWTGVWGDRSPGRAACEKLKDQNNQKQVTSGLRFGECWTVFISFQQSLYTNVGPVWGAETTPSSAFFGAPTEQTCQMLLDKIVAANPSVSFQSCRPFWFSVLPDE